MLNGERSTFTYLTALFPGLVVGCGFYLYTHVLVKNVVVCPSNTIVWTLLSKSLGYKTCTYVGIRLEKGSMYERVVSELNKIPEIVECHYTTGPYTMLVKLYARDNEQLMDLLNRKIQGITGVDSTETLISLDQSIKKEVPICVTDKPEEKVQKGGKAKIILDDDE